MKRKGLLVAIEGTDGSGKGTQVEMLKRVGLIDLESELKTYRFPQYNSTFFGSEIGKYLNGEYGELGSQNQKLVSLLFSLDRFESMKKINQDLENGHIVVCDRYVASNVAYQSSLVEDSEKSFEIANWINHVEHQVLELPEPDLTIFLDIPPHVSKLLVLRKAKRDYTELKEDIHEGDSKLIDRSYRMYKEFLAVGPNWVTINCINEGLIKSPEEINSEILKIIYEAFNKQIRLSIS